MRVNISAIILRLCVAGISFLGFGCTSEPEDMYGTPTGEWEIKEQPAEEKD